MKQLSKKALIFLILIQATFIAGYFSAANATLSGVISGLITAPISDKGGQTFNIRAYGAVCDAVIGGGVVTGTDDTAAIQAAINAARVTHNGRVIIPGWSKCSGTLDLSGAASGLVIEGEAGSAWAFPLDLRAAQSGLVYVGTGTTSFISMCGAEGVSFRDLCITYSSASFTGILVDFSCPSTPQTPTSTCSIERCRLTAAITGVDSAKAMIGVNNVVNIKILDCNIASALHLIRGIENASLDFSNDVTIQRCVLDSKIGGDSISNPSLQWYIRDSVFEFTVAGVTTGISADVPATVNGTFIDISGCSFWDPNASFTPQIPILQPVGHTWDLRVERCWFHNFTNDVIRLQGPGTAIIEDNTFTQVVSNANPSLIDLGASATALKGLVRITGNNWFANNDGAGFAANAIKNLTGHTNVEISNHAGLSGGRELKTLTAQERVGYQGGDFVLNRPSLAAHAGQTLADGSVDGTDAGGLIRIKTGGSPSIVGALADITFSKPLIVYPLTVSAIPAARRLPAVIITPTETAEGLGVDAYNAGAYIIVSNQNGFSIGTKNAIAANTWVVYSYRVIQN